MKLSENGTGTTEARPNKIEYLPDISPTRFRAKNLDTQYGSVKTNLQISPAGTFELPSNIEFLPGTRYSPDYKAYRIGCDTECEKHKERPFASGTAIHQIDLKAKKSPKCIAAPQDGG
ncbi:hypothetical protein [Mobiluncus mulieris]|uniref:hypothetical protein n=1 Tax=Mobiluncus mulieris TaxID=2052 RepID=UPI00242DCEFF|nr:hypothetical protein [Mobiluncus mulieris]